MIDLLSLDPGSYLLISERGYKGMDIRVELHKINRDNSIDDELVDLLDKSKDCYLVLKLNAIFDIICIHLTGFQDFETKKEMGIYGWIFGYCRKNKSQTVDAYAINKVLAENTPPDKIKLKGRKSSSKSDDSANYDTIAFVNARIKELT